MKRLLTSVLLATSVVGGFSLMGSHLGQAVAAADPGGETPQRVDDFRLTDTNLIGQQLSRFSDASAVVIVTYGNGCPIVRNSVAAMNALKAKYAGKGVEFLALDSTPQDTRDAVKAEAKEYGLDMPVMMDTNQLVGEQMGVTRTAEVFVINPKTWRVMYRGPVDDRVTYERQKAEASEHWADDAIAATLAHQPVAVARRPAQGCLVSFSATADKAAFSKISYAHDVAPIVSEKCVSCHQPGGIGPMPLTSYEQIKGYSPMIREVIRTRRMPPWHADPTVGHFMDDKSLSPTQIKTLVHWVEAGSPRGEGADPLKGKTYAVQEWPLGKPDVILDVPAYTIPASGVVDYQRPFIVNPLTKPEWLKASTIKVSNRQGVHHILTGLLTDVPTEGYASETKWGASVRRLRRGFRVGEGAEGHRGLPADRRRHRLPEPLHAVRQAGRGEEPDRALLLQERRDAEIRDAQHRRGRPVHRHRAERGGALRDRLPRVPARGDPVRRVPARPLSWALVGRLHQVSRRLTEAAAGVAEVRLQLAARVYLRRAAEGAGRFEDHRALHLR